MIIVLKTLLPNSLQICLLGIKIGDWTIKRSISYIFLTLSLSCVCEEGSISVLQFKLPKQKTFNHSALIIPPFFILCPLALPLLFTLLNGGLYFYQVVDPCLQVPPSQHWISPTGNMIQTCPFMEWWRKWWEEWESWAYQISTNDGKFIWNGISRRFKPEMCSRYGAFCLYWGRGSCMVSKWKVYSRPGFCKPACTATLPWFLYDKLRPMPYYQLIKENGADSTQCTYYISIFISSFNFFNRAKGVMKYEM